MSRDPFVSYAQNQEDVVLARALRPDDRGGLLGGRRRRRSRSGFGHCGVRRAGYVDAVAQLSASTFDAVLCDVVMPDGSGLKLLQETRAKHPELAKRFVLMTGGAVSRAEALALEATGVEVIAKPFDIQRLEAALQRLAG